MARGGNRPGSGRPIGTPNKVKKNSMRINKTVWYTPDELEQIKKSAEINGYKNITQFIRARTLTK